MEHRAGGREQKSEVRGQLMIVCHTEAPQLNRRKEAFNGAGRDRREKIFLALKEIKNLG